MDRGIFLDADQEWMIKWVPALFESMRRYPTTQQWIRYISNWPVTLKALRQLWERGKVSELKSPFWESLQKPANQ